MTEEKTGQSLADKLFGPKPPISDRAIQAISDPDSMERDELFPVKVHTYIDPGTKKLRKQLDSRGITYTEGLSEHPGVVRIDEKEYKRLTEKSRRKPKNYRVENPQNGINLQVDVTRLNGDEVLFRAELEPNDHGIESTGPKHYKIKPRELYPVFREPHPNVKMIEGVNFALFKGNTTVDLIND